MYSQQRGCVIGSMLGYQALKLSLLFIIILVSIDNLSPAAASDCSAFCKSYKHLARQTPGWELLEIRHWASHSQFLKAPPTLFAFLSIHPKRRLYFKISAGNSQIQPLQQHRTLKYPKGNLGQWEYLKQTCKCNPFNSFITVKIYLIPLQSLSLACPINTPLELKK